MKPILHLLGNFGWQPAPPTPNNAYLEFMTWKFITSFRKGILRNTLESSFFKIREINHESDFQTIKGKCLFITHNSWKDYNRLISKWRSLGYRLKKLNPEIAYLWLQDPAQVTSILVDLKQQKAFNITLTEGDKA